MITFLNQIKSSFRAVKEIIHKQQLKFNGIV
jgi:hypothetical protein